MARESLTACEAGIIQAKVKRTSKRLTQEKLAAELEISRQPIANFFRGKPVDRTIFVQICELLKLDWQEIAGQPKSTDLVSSPDSVSTDINALVQEVRKKIKPYIEERCGTMRVLDMTQPVGLSNIYTDVNILEKITGRRRLTAEDLQEELLKNSNLDELDRFGLSTTQKRVPGLNAVQEHSKLMVLGKPGAGKTTFLKYLAMQCIEGQFQSNRFPIFITLKDFAEAPGQPNVLDYMTQWLSNYELTNAKGLAEQLLREGKVLVLLDGLDEVQEKDTKRVLKQVQEFSYQFNNNQFVITCRIAAKEYTFQGFTEVEVADFNKDQIATFAQNWFRLKDPVKGERFMQKLEENKPIQELATNPLLLTLLCLVFGEAGNFPVNRSELYTEGIDVLLKKWDVGRNIEREQVYKDLSLQRKQDLLSQIALTTFERHDYFFKKKTVEEYIADFISNLGNARTEHKELELDSEAVLKSIEAHHGLLVARATGIYSFSHLTFHEYFTAREIKERSAWEKLTKYITEKRWREVFLLTTGMMRQADDLVQLMKQKIDSLLAEDEKLQQFLTWAEEKSRRYVQVRYKPATVRVFYIYLDRNLAFALDRNLAFALDRNLAFARELALALDLSQDLSLDLSIVREYARNYARNYALHLGLDRALARALAQALAFDLSQDLSLALDLSQDLSLALDLSQDLSLVLNLARNLELQSSLQQLKNQLPEKKDYSKAYKSWWQANGKAWIEQLRTVMIQYRNIGHGWQFSDSQKELLNQYLNANQLLVDCLNSDCYVSREVRQHIEDTLLLPVKNDIY